MSGNPEGGDGLIDLVDLVNLIHIVNMVIYVYIVNLVNYVITHGCMIFDARVTAAWSARR